MSKTKLFLIALIAIVAAVGLYFYWEHEIKYPNTDDAYLNGNILFVTPQVSGQIDQVAVVENQYVEAGDPLFSIKADSYQAAVDAAEAQLALATQSAGASVDTIASTEAQVQAAQAALTNAQAAFDRTEKLFKTGDVAKAALETAMAARDQAKAQLAAAQSTSTGTKLQSGDAGPNNASIRAALANLKIAQINLAHATMAASTNGWIADISLRPGQFVQPGQSLFAIVEDDSWWIDANFKETDIQRIRPGQPVSILIDMYPNLTLSGTVESLGAGSGSVFSLVPSQNATGNWVKVTQRFPARIKLNKTDNDPAFQLRAGASVTVTVDTSSIDAPSK